MLKEQAISLLTQVKKIILGSESWLDSVHQPIEEAFSMAIEALKQPKPIKGEWIERSVDVDGKKSIEEWQSAKCSVCGKYHTTPYLYYFDDYNYCPNCGAKMEREQKHLGNKSDLVILDEVKYE